MARLRSLLSSNWSTPYATEVLPGHVLPRRFGLYLEITGATEEGSVLLGDEEPALDSGGGHGGAPRRLQSRCLRSRALRCAMGTVTTSPPGSCW